MKETKTAVKLTAAQAYAAHLKAVKRAKAAERRDPAIAADNARVSAMYKRGEVTPKVKIAGGKKAAKKVRWTDAELNYAIVVYLNFTYGNNTAVNNKRAVAEVQVKYSNRNYGAVNMLFGQIRGLDSYAPQEGLIDTSEALINRLYEVDPLRFPSGVIKGEKIANALDNLLAEIRG